MVLSSLVAGRIGAAGSVRDGYESGSVGTAGSGAPRKGDARLPGAAEETDVVGRQTAYGAWAGTAHLVSDALTLERGTTVFANWHYPSNIGTKTTTLMRGHRRSLWLAAWKGSEAEGLDALER